MSGSRLCEGQKSCSISEVAAKCADCVTLRECFTTDLIVELAPEPRRPDSVDIRASRRRARVKSLYLYRCTLIKRIMLQSDEQLAIVYVTRSPPGAVRINVSLEVVRTRGQFTVKRLGVARSH